MGRRGEMPRSSPDGRRIALLSVQQDDIPGHAALKRTFRSEEP